MTRKRKFILAGAWIVSVVLAFEGGGSYEKWSQVLQPLTETEAIMVDGKPGVYVKKYSWGLLGNHSVVYLTNSESRTRYDEQQDQLLSKSGTVFFKVSGDTLVIYCREKPQSNLNFTTNLQIQYIELNNAEFMGLYDQLHGQIKSSDWM